MNTIEIRVPDIGSYADVPVIEVLVKPGDSVRAEDPLITLESDKATMEVPAPSSGRVAEINIGVGDKVSAGSLILKLLPEGAAAGTAGDTAQIADTAAAASASAPGGSAAEQNAAPSSPTITSNGNGHAGPFPAPTDFGSIYASPSVRRLARELDIDPTKLKGTGDKGRITKDDVKRALGASGAAQGAGIPAIPAQDFAKFGPISTKPLSRMKRLSGPHLHRAWLNIPHVTHTDEADITELEVYRKQLDAAAKDKGYRVTLLSFLLMATVTALKQHPEFNASLSPSGEELILKHYFNIGVAVDTPDGLVVPVIKDVDRKRIIELSQELAGVSQKMRDGKIAPTDIQGATFSISSLGGIGGTNFTPIVNAPEVAILGVVRARMTPVWNGDSFEPRLMLPLCLSYDHRVIDGALAARFTRRLAEVLGDVRQLVL